MRPIVYHQYVKDEAVRRYREGEDSTKIASDMGISSGALIRKWAEKDRNEKDIPVDEYRKSIATKEESVIQRLRKDNLKVKKELIIALKFIALIFKGEITGWEELLSRLRPPEE